MKEYMELHNDEFIKKYDVRIVLDDDGNPTTKIRSNNPVPETDFIEELMWRKSDLLRLLVPDGYKVVKLWVIAYGYEDEDGNRLEGYSITHVTFDEIEAIHIVAEDLDSVPLEERKGAVIYKDEYDLIVPADDARTADELFADVYTSGKWPYPTGVEFLHECW